MTTLYHFVLTLQLPTPTGMDVKTWSSTANVPPGRGRYDVYKDIRATLTADAPEWARANVLHWSLELDELPHAAPSAPPAPTTEAGPSGTPVRGQVPRQR
ncbi:hypothetical protein ABZ135_36920 [Streptomyces sp. NPDC006339]|uniref:hypothetical protein n=1 Tax=Streptomyces sp. NPDC006339 TaxID=3156755 RepID=UPI00339F4081